MVSPGFSLHSSSLSPEVLAGWCTWLAEIVGSDTHVSHYDLPPEIAEAVAADPVVQAVVRDALGASRRVHGAVHNNPSGAVPLDWHSDDCRPWFEGHVSDAPRALRIWLFPQFVPFSRGPLELVPSGKDFSEGQLILADAGDFIAVSDMALVHRQRANVSGEPRFMIRLEYVAVELPPQKDRRSGALLSSMDREYPEPNHGRRVGRAPSLDGYEGEGE